MTAEFKRQIDPIDDFDFGPPGSDASASRLSATAPDPSNMAALLMSMMERMERNERRTTSALDEMQARLADMTKQAETASVTAADAEEAARTATVQEQVDDLARRADDAGQSQIDRSAFAMLEQRLSEFQVPSFQPEAPSLAAEPVRRIVLPSERSFAPAAIKTKEPLAEPAPPAESGAESATPAYAPGPYMFAPRPEIASPASQVRSPAPELDPAPSFARTIQRLSMEIPGEPPAIIERRRYKDPEDAAAASEIPATARERTEPRLFEDRFDTLASRFEAALSSVGGSADIEALNAKLDNLSRDLAGALSEPAQALGAIEQQLGDISRSFGETERRFQKMDDLDGHLSELIAALSDAPGKMEQVADDAASKAMRLASHVTDAAPLASRLEAIHAELTAFDGRSRVQTERLADAVDGMQRMLGNLMGEGLGASSAPSSPADKPAAPAMPQAQQIPDIARILAGTSGDAEFEDSRSDGGDTQLKTSVAEKARSASALRELLGAQADKAQAIPPKAKQAVAEKPAPQSRPAEKDDFVAAARRAAQAAAARANEKTKPAPPISDAAATKQFSAKTPDVQLTRPRPILVIAAAVLLIASAALLYTRLQSKPAAPAQPAVEQQAPAASGGAQTPDKSSDVRDAPAPRDSGETLLARGLGELDRRSSSKTYSDRVGAPVQSVSIAPAGSAEGDLSESIVVKSAGDDTGEFAGQLQLPPAEIGPYSMRLAAAQGDAAASFEVGSRYAEGKGVAQDWAEAARWYGRAAGLGYAPAQYRLAVLHERGQGVDKDAARARIWYGRAAELGNIKSMHNLAVTMSGQNATPEDYARAAEWFAKAAEQGLADSQFNLAIFFENGFGVTKDIVEAYKWYALAANQMDVDAAARRDALKAQLDPAALEAADKAVKAWRPAESKEAANEPRNAAGGWGDAAGL